MTGIVASRRRADVGEHGLGLRSAGSGVGRDTTLTRRTWSCSRTPDAGATMMPSMFLRTAAGWYHWPRRTCVGYCVQRTCTASAIAFCFAGSVSRANSSRSFSSSASHGQPNGALSQLAFRNAVDTGFRMSADTHDVSIACQPPCAGGSFFARRATTRLPVHRLHVDLEAALFQQRFGHRREVGQHLQVGRMQQHDRRAVVAGFLQQRLRLGEVGLEQAVHALGRRERRAADEHRLAHLVVLLDRRSSPCRKSS